MSQLVQDSTEWEMQTCPALDPLMVRLLVYLLLAGDYGSSLSVAQ